MGLKRSAAVSDICTLTTQRQASHVQSCLLFTFSDVSCGTLRGMTSEFSLNGTQHHEMVIISIWYGIGTQQSLSVSVS